MSRLYNYTSLKQRDTKIYNVGGYNLAGGISIEFLKVVGPTTIAGIVLGAIIAIPFGISFLNPLGDKFIPAYTIAFLVLGIGPGLLLWYIQFAGYRLYEYLIAYFKPKKVYANDFRNTEYVLNDIKIDAMVKNIL